MVELADVDPEIPAIEAIQRGDRDAFDAFVGRQSRWVRGVVFGLVRDIHRVDDICQDIWTTVWEQIGKLRDSSRWRYWLYRLARNAAIDTGRRQQRHRQAQQTLMENTRPESVIGANVTDQLIVDERHRLVLEAIRGLPAIYREPFVLRHLEEWSYKQIAELLDLPTDTVETRLVRARRLLRDALKDRI